MSMAARFETQYTIVLSTWSASTSSLVIFEDHLPYDPWVKLIRITVDTKSISPCWGTHPSIRLRSSYNLRVTQSYELPISRLRSLDTLPPPQSSKWKYGQGRNSECVSRRWQLVAATLSARPPPKHWKRSDGLWRLACGDVFLFVLSDKTFIIPLQWDFLQGRRLICLFTQCTALCIVPFDVTGPKMWIMSASLSDSHGDCHVLH